MESAENQEAPSPESSRNRRTPAPRSQPLGFARPPVSFVDVAPGSAERLPLALECRLVYLTDRGGWVDKRRAYPRVSTDWGGPGVRIRPGRCVTGCGSGAGKGETPAGIPRKVET